MIPPILLVALVVLIYFPVVQLGFVSDDHGLIVHEIMGIANQSIADIFGQDLWHSQESQSGYYRPLMMLSLWLDHALWGDWAGGYHLQSLAWHLAATLVLFGLISRLLGPHRAFVAAGLFAAHPVLTEVVCFISARNDAMAITLSMAAVWSALPQDASRRRVFLACVLAWTACLSKEIGVVGLLLLPLLDWAKHGELRGAHRYGALATGAVAWLFMREMIGPGLFHGPPLAGAELLQSKRAIVMGTLLGKVSWPWPLSDSIHIAYLDMVPVPAAAATVFLLGYLALTGGRFARAGVTFACLALMPCLLAIASRHLIGERYLAMSLVGVVLAIVAILPDQPRARLVLLVALPWAWIAHDRVPDWTTDLSLAESAHEARPTPYTAAWLGHELVRAGRAPEAFHSMEYAIQGQPPTCDFAGEWVRMARRLRGPEAAVTTAQKIWNARCAAAPGVRGEWAHALLLSGDRAAAEAILTPPPERCDGTLAPPLAALATAAGDEETAGACVRESGRDGPELQREVEAILTVIEVDEPDEPGHDSGTPEESQ